MGEPATGGRLGPILHALLARKDIDVAQVLAPMQRAEKQRLLHEFMEAGESHVGEWIGPLVAEITGHEETPAWLADMLKQIAGPEAQFDFLVQILAIPSMVLAIIFNIGTPMVQDLLNTLWTTHQDVPLSAQDVALNELRGGVAKGRGAQEAAFTGINALRYQALLENVGEPPAIQELLFLLRRNKISQDRVEHGIRQSRVRDEWIDAVLDLAYGPPTAADAIMGAVKGFLNDGDAQRIVAENGVDPSNYEWMRESAGRPPGTEQMLHLLNRGEVSEAQVVQSIRESDVKNKYIPAILKMRRQLMPQRTVVSAIHQGVLSTEAGVEHLLLLGYNADDAATLAAEGSAHKVAHIKTLNESLIVGGYENGLLTRAEADAHLVALGYEAAEADYILSVTDARADHRQRDQAVSAIRARFLHGHLDQTEAQTTLVHLGVPGATVDRLLALWTEERGTVVAELTLAQLGAALKKKWITEADYLHRLSLRGYNAADAAILAALAQGLTNPNAPA
jgi:hypothetical protein